MVTQPDKPKGRELKLQPSPVKVLAEKLRLARAPAAQRARDENFIANCAELKPDLIVVVAYGQILPPAHLGFAALWLPERPHFAAAEISRRGADSMGDRQRRDRNRRDHHENGRRPGHRPDFAHRRTPILPADDSPDACTTGSRNSARNCWWKPFPDYVAGKIQPQPQPAEGASYAPKIKKEDGRIDWNLPAQEIWNRLRAFTPWPGAFTIGVQA